MIGTLLRIYFTNLRRDRVVQAMTFFLPIAFFSIFAAVFGRQGRDTTSPVRVAVVDEDQTDGSRRLVRALQREGGLRVVLNARPSGSAPGTPAVTLDRARARALVQNGDVPVAVVLPKGFSESVGNFDSASGEPVQLLADTGDPIAPRVVGGLLQKAAMTASPDLLARNGIAQFEKYGGGLTPQQRKMVDTWLPMMRQESLGDSARGDSAAGATGGSEMSGLVHVRTIDVLGERKKNPLVAFYAAGIAVMFLLFMSSGAGGGLIDEVDAGTLERLLTSNVGMTGVLAGKWLYVTLLGMLQITVMFLWGAFAFKLDFFAHIPGFLVMTAATAAAAAGFGLVLATLCRTRAQLGALSTILVLVQSALGGSMFPRFLMSEGMQKMGLFTFNAWALDGYIKVFWRDAPIVELWPQVLALLLIMTFFLVTARLLARRWESA